jgi:hypothetical protein
MFSVLVEDPFRPNIANNIHLSLDDINPLGPNFDEYAKTLFDRVVGDGGREQNMVQVSTSLIYNFPGNLLPLALVSFSGSHVCRFDLERRFSSATSLLPRRSYYVRPPGQGLNRFGLIGRLLGQPSLVQGESGLDSVLDRSTKCNM